MSRSEPVESLESTGVYRAWVAFVGIPPEFFVFPATTRVMAAEHTEPAERSETTDPIEHSKDFVLVETTEIWFNTSYISFPQLADDILFYGS